MKFIKTFEVLQVDFTYHYIIELSSILSILNLVETFHLELVDLHFHVGSDIMYDNQFSIRLGYVTGFEAKGIR